MVRMDLLTRQPAASRVKDRVRALAQPMPGHEVADIDFDVRRRISPRAAAGAVGIVLLVLVAVAGARWLSTGQGDDATVAGPAGVAVGMPPGVTTGPSAGNAPATGGPGGRGTPGGTSGAAGPSGQRGHPDAGGPGAGGAGTPGQDPSPPVRPVVSVQGMVRTPGLIRVDDGTRLGEALDRAGGPLPGAVLAGVNLAEPVSDGMQVTVDDQGSTVAYPGQSAVGRPAAAAGAAPGPAPGGAPGGGAGAPGGAGARPGGAGGPGRPGAPGGGAGAAVNINTADEAALTTIPGIGPRTAQAIIAWRDQNGPFGSVDQLMEVKGIGPAKLEAMRSAVTV